MAEALKWGAGQKERFLQWIVVELRTALDDRKPLETRWVKWLTQYRAAHDQQAVKSFPFVGASNKLLPITAMDVDPTIARELTTLHAAPNLWTLQALNERWVDAAKPLQDYLQYLEYHTLKMWDVNYRARLERAKLGTCIYKHGWRYERRKTRTYDSKGALVTGTSIISAPFVDHVRNVDFVMPGYAYAIQPDDQGGAPWVAERIWLRIDQFEARASGQSPFLPNYDTEAVSRVRKLYEQRFTDDEATRQKLDENEATRGLLQRVELFEVHARFDVGGNGEVDDVIALVHLDSRSLLRATPNPYRHGQRPYEVDRYFRSDGFWGIGIGEQTEMFQGAESELLNLQFDNVLASNSIMLGVKMGANVVAGEPIYPFKIWMLDNPDKDIREIRFGQVRSDLPILQAYIGQMRERRDGYSDLQRGNPSQLPSRTPATTMLSLLQEGNRRFDLSLKDTRLDCLGRVGLRVLQNLQQFGADPQRTADGAYYLQLAATVLGQPEGALVQQMLALPIEDIENGIGCSITATSGMANKEVEKQSLLALLQLQTQLGQQFIQLAQVASNPAVLMQMPAVAMVAQQVAKGLTELQKRVLEQYDIRNPEDILINTATLQSATQAFASGVPFQPGTDFVGGGNGGAGPMVGGAGVGALPPAAGNPV